MGDPSANLGDLTFQKETRRLNGGPIGQFFAIKKEVFRAQWETRRMKWET
ncbi:hypothetical protein KDAU_12470 [Dictyobacter aurantiacus]|uniref:Uncharacterized protein n=1 Tax=Dictyobacter aurantiacus TaxID=1936993 RepID=A0A401ZAV5_9CHLR|nr:hypothetical protein KDAU_12470 [Dictyobacter aurantiacus]